MRFIVMYVLICHRVRNKENFMLNSVFFLVILLKVLSKPQDAAASKSL